jgi:sterol desaturase/sphingolipid hydroxylase (fatty acid hydroxylase superfamily)
MTTDARFLIWAVPLFVALVVLEIWLYRRRGGATPYLWGESLGTIGVALGRAASNLVKGGVTLGASWLAWEHRIWTVPLDSWWGMALLFLGVELAYYWFHRLSHEVRWMWATHAVHHSPEHLTILAAYRLGWTSAISGGWVVYLPLMVLGFHPLAVFGMLSLNLLYQSWIHTDLIPKLGWLEWVLNTPSHHRVHHAVNPLYLDRNYGGVTVIFDRLFGTLVPERAEEPCRYGLTTPVGSNNPFVIAFHEWARMGRDVLKARGAREVLGTLFGPPGWKADGTGRTAAVMRREWLQAHGEAPPAPATAPSPREDAMRTA